jgi:cephalosporin hydroxylase
MTFDRKKFEDDRLRNAETLSNDNEIQALALDFLTKSDRHYHAYQWTWLDLPIIQMPEDVITAQELIWKVQPDVIIETGIAWGGSIVFSASMLQLMGKGSVIGVDVVLPQKNIDAIMKYPFSSRITLMEGSSTDPQTIARIKAKIKPGDKVLVMLDSNHTHDHVLEELKLYSPFVSTGSYIIVSDTFVERVPERAHAGPRPWGKGNNPQTAVDEFLKSDKRFVPDAYYNNKALNSYTKGGFLRCIK